MARNIILATLALVCLVALIEAYPGQGRMRDFRGRVRRFFSPDREFEFSNETIIVSKMALFHAQKIRKLAAFEQCSKEISDEDKNSVDSAFFHNVISNGYDSIRNYLKNLKEQIHERIILIRKVLDCVHNKPTVVIGRVKSSKAQAVLVLHPNMTVSAAYFLDSRSSLRAIAQELPHPSMDISFEETEFREDEDDFAEGSESVFETEDEPEEDLSGDDLSFESEHEEEEAESDFEELSEDESDFQSEEFNEAKEDDESNFQSEEFNEAEEDDDSDFQSEELEQDDSEFDSEFDSDFDGESDGLPDGEIDECTPENGCTRDVTDQEGDVGF